jgi:multidrug resistance efflux pump
MKRLLISGVVLTVGCVLLLLSLRSGKQGEPEIRLRHWTVSSAQVAGVVRERGWVVSSRSAPVAAAMSGDVAELLSTGTRVHAGDVVLRVDDSKTRDSLEEREASAEGAQLVIELAQAERELMRVEQENMIGLIKRRLAFARMEYEAAVAGLRPAERRQLEIKIEEAELALLDVRDELARQDRLQGKGFASESMVEPYRRRVATAEAALEETKLQLELEEAGAPEEELVQLKRQYERYEASVARGREGLERKMAAADAKVAGGEARMKRESARLARTRADLSNTVARAQIDGVVQVRLYADWRSGGGWVPYRAGQSIRRGDRVADVVDLGVMGMELMVHESDINRLAVGMSALVRIAAFPGRVFKGRLEELGGVGRDRRDVAPRGFEGGFSGVTMFNARVSIDAAGQEFRPGMSGMVAFQMQDAAGALLVPREFVRAGVGGLEVAREAGRGREWVSVSGALFDERFYRIEAGLSEGDVVVLEEVVPR